MKTLLTTIILLTLLTSCYVARPIIKGGKEYVRIEQLEQLTPIDRFRLHWKTMNDSPFAIYDNLNECFMYDKNFDYKTVLKKKSPEVENYVGRMKSIPAFWKWIIILLAIGLLLDLHFQHPPKPPDKY